MVHQSDSQQYLSVYDPIPPRSRQSSGLSGSIWAPQPQPSGTTWPKTLDTFSKAAELQSDLYPFFEARNVTREDIFGPATQKNTREIGAIGDGRKKNSPDYDNTVRLLFSFFLFSSLVVLIFFFLLIAC